MRRGHAPNLSGHHWPRTRISARNRDRRRQRTHPHPRPPRPTGLPLLARTPSNRPPRAPRRPPALRGSRGARVSTTARPHGWSRFCCPRLVHRVAPAVGGGPRFLAVYGSCGWYRLQRTRRPGRATDTSETANSAAAPKPRPEWVQGKAESRQLNNHLSSANPSQRARAPEKSQAARIAHTARPLLGGLQDRAARPAGRPRTPVSQSGAAAPGTAHRARVQFPS